MQYLLQIKALIDALKDWLYLVLITKKLNSFLGILLLVCICVLIGGFVAILELKGAIFAIAVVFAITSVLFALFNQYTCLYIILTLGCLVPWLSKIRDMPYGISLDALLMTMSLGILMKQSYKRDLSFLKSPITIPIVLWIVYNLIQVLNPSAVSQLAWVYTVRSVAILHLLYFIACYALNSYRRIVSVFKFMLFMAFVAAIYGLGQEYIGFSRYEMIWLHSDMERFQLIFQWGRLRIFSFFSDPTNFGMYLSYYAVISCILLTGPFKTWQKVAIGFSAACMFLAMGLAGSRTPFILVPFGLIIFTLLTLNKKIILTMIFTFMLGSVFMLKSTNNAIIFRIQSAFSSTSSDTMDVRLNNQKMIQPFIRAHPFGAGLGSAGQWGARFAPNSILAKFPPDSGFVRIAVELGWLGLILYFYLLFKVVNFSIHCYLRVRHPKVKIIYLSLTVMIFMLFLASYPQEAIIQLPTSLCFYVTLAIIARLKDFEHEAYLEDG